MLDRYFQVYTFTDKVMGLTIELDYNTISQNIIVDSLFAKVAERDSLDFVISQKVKSSSAIDTTGRFRFFRNAKLEKMLLNGVNKKFFIYCTKGVVERTIKDVVFSFDECQSNIVVFRFDQIDIKEYGQPIFCSRQELNLTFKNLPQVDLEIEKVRKGEQHIYADSIKQRSFAQADALYFMYSDDFNWNLGKELKNYFPSRTIYIKRKDNKFYSKWSLGLDLFGIPCD